MTEKQSSCLLLRHRRFDRRGDGRVRPVAAPIAAVLLAAALGGCDEDEPSSADRPPAVASAARSAPPAPGPEPSASAAAPASSDQPPQLVRAPARVCRAIAVRGEVTTPEARPIASMDPLDETGWLELGEGASVTVRHAQSTRELTFDGPGKVWPCYHEDEQFIVHSGTVHARAGAGARPGAEVVIATPFGVVRYGDSDLTATVAGSLEVEVRSGEAWVEGPGSEPAPETVSAHQSTSRTDSEAVELLVQRCKDTAERARERARAVLDRSKDRSTLGQRAAEHLRARQEARKACGIAVAAVGPRTAKTASAIREIDRAEERWREVPEGPSPPKAAPKK